MNSSKKKGSLNNDLENLSTFREKVTNAQFTGEGWIETSEELIQYLHPNLPKKKYFWYGKPAVRVCRFGDKEEIEREESIPLSEKIFGKEEGKLTNK